MTNDIRTKNAERYRTEQRAGVILAESPHISLKDLRSRLKRSGFTHPLTSKDVRELCEIVKCLLENPGTGHARVDSPQLASVLRRIHAERFKDKEAELLIERFAVGKTATRSALEEAYGEDAVAVLGKYLKAQSTTTRKPGKLTVVKALPSLDVFRNLRIKCFTRSLWAALSQAHAIVSEESNRIGAKLDGMSDGARTGVRGEALEVQRDAMDDLMFALLPTNLKPVLTGLTFFCSEAVYAKENDLTSGLAIMTAILAHLRSICTGLGAISQLDERFGSSKASRQVVTQMMVLRDDLAEFIDEIDDAVDRLDVS